MQDHDVEVDIPNSKSTEVVTATHADHRSSNPPGGQLPTKYDWSRLDTFAKHMLEKEIAREREDRQEIHRKVKEDLDRQMDDIHKRRYRERMDDVAFSRQQAEDLEMWKIEENKKEEARRLREENEKIDRDEQLRFDDERKKGKERRQQEEDRRQAEAIQKAIAKERDDANLKRQKEKLLTKQLMEENERDRQVKLELKRQSATDELKQLREYHDMIEKQEAERQNELSRRIERQKQLIKRMEEGVLKTIQAKSNDDNVRALKQQAEMDARAIEIEKYKTERLRQLKEEMTSTLKKQIEDKDKRRREEDELRKIHARILHKDATSFDEAEAEKLRARKDRLKKYQEQLKEQIDEGRLKQKSQRDELSIQEILINRELIEVVEATLPQSLAAVGCYQSACTPYRE